MQLHLVKLSVGTGSITQLSEWQQARLARRMAEGAPAELFHRTRHMPRRKDELLAGGSIYWVIKGVILVRQRLLDFREAVGDDGIRRCDIIYDPELVPTRPRPRRAFQGWRYLPEEDAPRDLGSSGLGEDQLPEHMRSELIELGLL